MSDPSKSNNPTRSKGDQPESGKAKQGAYAPKSAPPVAPTDKDQQHDRLVDDTASRNTGEEQDDGKSRQ